MNRQNPYGDRVEKKVVVLSPAVLGSWRREVLGL